MKGDVMLGPSCQVERRVRVLHCFRRPRGLKANEILSSVVECWAWMDTVTSPRP